MEKAINLNTAELKDFRQDFNSFTQLSGEEHDRVKNQLETIISQTAENAENVFALASVTGKQTMDIERIKLRKA